MLFVACGSPSATGNSDTDIESALRLTSDDQHKPLPQVTLSPSLALSSLPAKSQAYRIDAPEVDEEYVRSVAAKFGFTGEPTYNTKVDHWKIDDALGDLLIFSDGAYSAAFSGEPPTFSFGEQVGVPDEQARTTAEDYLREKRLLPEDARFNHITRDGVGTAYVVFANSILGVAGDIAGAPAIVVGVGSEGDVENVSFNWPLLEPAGEYNIVSQKEAARRFLDGMWYGSISPGIYESVALDWTARESDSGNRFLIPCYLFRSQDSRVEVPALADDHLFPD
jgi:hypothetical protein